MLTDMIIRDGDPVEACVPNPCRYVGPKKLFRDGSPLMAKAQGCKNTPENVRPIIFTPVYECSEFRRCAPFAKEIEDEADSAHPCQNCPRYKPPLAKIEPIIHDERGSDATLV